MTQSIKTLIERLENLNPLRRVTDGGVEADTQKLETGPVRFRWKQSVQPLPGSCGGTVSVATLQPCAGVASGPSVLFSREAQT